MAAIFPFLEVLWTVTYEKNIFKNPVVLVREEDCSLDLVLVNLGNSEKLSRAKHVNAQIPAPFWADLFSVAHL